MRHLPALDGLRGVGVLLVVWAHLPIATGGLLDLVSHRLAGLLLAGHLGVDLFFALSGFLITRILLDQRASGVGLGAAATTFYRRRLVRILPIYYLLILVCAIGLPGYAYLAPAAYAANYAMALDLTAHPLRHTWSLAVEEQFYLLWPWLVLTLPVAWLGALTRWWIPAASLAASGAVMAITDAEVGCALLERGLESRALTLSLGAALAIRPPTDVGRLAPTVVAGIALALVIHAARFACPVQIATLVKHAGSAMISFLVLRWLIANTDSKAWPVRVLASRPLTAVGRISYGLYLYHFVIFFLLDRVLTRPEDPVGIVPALMAIVLSVAVAGISYRWIETPLLRLKKRIDHRAEAPAAGGASTLPIFRPSCRNHQEPP